MDIDKAVAEIGDKEFVYVARCKDGTIYGVWTSKSDDATEVLAIDNPDVVAFLQPKPAALAPTFNDFMAAFIALHDDGNAGPWGDLVKKYRVWQSQKAKK